jgi:hypothetical protein
MATDGVRDRLLDWYRRYIGEPDARTDVYLGFGLFFGGIAFGLLGLLLFLWSATIPAGTLSDPNMAHWTLREVAIGLGLLGLPAILVSVVVLLPVRERVQYAGATGSAVALLAVVGFVLAYPFNFNLPAEATNTDYLAHVVVLYAAGMVAVIGSTGAALVAHQLDRATADSGNEESEAESAEDVSDEQVRRDIDEAMDDAELTWGGVRADDTRRLTIETDEEEAAIDRSGFDNASARKKTTVRSESTDDAVSGLEKLRGGQKQEARSSGTDDQAAALRELRAQQREGADRAESGGLLSGLLARIRALFGGE